MSRVGQNSVSVRTKAEEAGRKYVADVQSRAAAFVTTGAITTTIPTQSIGRRTIDAIKKVNKDGPRMDQRSRSSSSRG